MQKVAWIFLTKRIIIQQHPKIGYLSMEAKENKWTDVNVQLVILLNHKSIIKSVFQFTVPAKTMNIPCISQHPTVGHNWEDNVKHIPNIYVFLQSDMLTVLILLLFDLGCILYKLCYYSLLQLMYVYTCMNTPYKIWGGIFFTAHVFQLLILNLNWYDIDLPECVSTKSIFVFKKLINY